MPREYRRLTFPPAELRGALRELRRCRPDLVPRGDVRPGEFVETEEGLCLRLSTTENGGEPEGTLTAEAVAAALILFCQRMGIPAQGGRQGAGGGGGRGGAGAEAVTAGRAGGWPAGRGGVFAEARAARRTYPSPARGTCDSSSGTRSRRMGRAKR